MTQVIVLVGIILNIKQSSQPLVIVTHSSRHVSDYHCFSLSDKRTPFSCR